MRAKVNQSCHNETMRANNALIKKYEKSFQGTLMQIWKFHYMLGFMQKQYPGNFAISNLKNPRVIYPWSLNFPKK